MFASWMAPLPEEASVLLCLGLILLCGFASTRLTRKLGLPDVSGYILCGILMGPHLLGVIPQYIVDRMGFVSDIALAFIAFGVGRFFKRETLQTTGVSVLIITLLEALLAGVMVTVAMVSIFHLDWSPSLLLGAIATATASASTLMTIQQYHARGSFVNILLQIVALDDVVCLMAFSVASAIVNAQADGVITASDVVLPFVYNLAAMGLGAVFALLLSRMLPPSRSRDNRLILALALLLCLSGICAAANVSPLLSCMIFGAVYINHTNDKKLFKQINKFTPPIMIFFFVVSGMKLDLSILKAFGLAGVGYFLARILGKYLGAWAGSFMTGQEKKTRVYLGAALVPQAGVAVGLAYLAERLLPSDIGRLLVTIILASSVLYELIGPACAKMALFRSGAIARRPLPGKETAAPAEEKKATGSDEAPSQDPET